jgi:hypothetical protein
MQQANSAADDPIVVSIPWPDYYGGLLAELPFWPLQTTGARLAADAVRREPAALTNPRSGLRHALGVLTAWRRQGAGRVGTHG